MSIEIEIKEAIERRKILPSQAEVKRLVKADRWQQLGSLFGFVPVFHFGGKSFIDWRCVPESLLDILQPDFIKNRIRSKGLFPDTVSNLYAGALANKNRVQKRKEIRALMHHAKWDELEEKYHWRPRFWVSPIGKHVVDWTAIPGEIFKILKCGGDIQRTLYTLEGGIYNPKEKPKNRTPKRNLVPVALRVARHTLVERIPIRQRLYEAQSGTCFYCRQKVEAGSYQWTIDHKLPISRGGTNEDFNLVGACATCNSNKSSMTDAEFLESAYFKSLKL